MTKLALQKELQEKVKLGVKPSDLKKKRTLSIPTPPISPIIEPIKPNQIKKTPDLTTQIQSLQHQLQLYKDFKEADLKIKEKLKKENEALKKTIAHLKEQGKNQAKTPPKTFLCSHCQQE